MKKEINNFSVSDQFEQVLLETCRDKGISRPRVKPHGSGIFPDDIRVEFPRHLRESHPIGTRFRADLKVSQKTDKSTGEPFGQPYLSVDAKTIRVEADFVPQLNLRAIKKQTTSGRVYTYITHASPILTSFENLRNLVYDKIKEEPVSHNNTSTTIFDRSQLLITYALSRADGYCEGCEQPAPFLKKNGQPYLEVHHIEQLSNNGSDFPTNVAALCPNCHRRVTFGQDQSEYNATLKAKIRALELAFNPE